MQQPIEARACQSIAGFMSTCPQTEVNDHPASFGITYGQNLEPPSHCWFSRLELALQISNYPNSSWCWIYTIPIRWPKILLH